MLELLPLVVKKAQGVEGAERLLVDVAEQAVAARERLLRREGGKEQRGADANELRRVRSSTFGFPVYASGTFRRGSHLIIIDGGVGVAHLFEVLGDVVVDVVLQIMVVAVEVGLDPGEQGSVQLEPGGVGGVSEVIPAASLRSLAPVLTSARRSRATPPSGQCTCASPLASSRGCGRTSARSPATRKC